MEKKIFKIVIFTDYKCNNRCPFCMNANKRYLPAKTTETVIEEIYLAKQKGVDYLEIIGGEPTIRPDFLQLIRTAKKVKIKDIAIATNGRMFSNIKFAKDAVKAGLTNIIFSIHGHNARLHESLTQVPGSFKQLLKGLENLRELGFNNINGNTTIVRQNMKYLKNIGHLYLKLYIRDVEFIFVDPTYGGAYDNFEKYVPKISVASNYMREMLDLGKKHNAFWKVRYVPLCYFRGYENRISEIYEKNWFYTKHWAPDFINEDVSLARAQLSREKTSQCNGCKMYDSCEGIWKEYIKRYGDLELKPIK